MWVCANVLGMGVESVWYAVVVSNATSALIPTYSIGQEYGRNQLLK